ncbi:sialic acid-binding Ig-like lectin 15 isoform X2 [Microcaecilia unicolor]|uniref:Sialic acid-binding Ig-like lectin 15 isoform X2 n=1 Tax=Microcaecilia unicolor TaxID=1415580 RepID=A0A6P7WWY6_9AMPH|nr:sialic acid-binding Ig-like lectin 15 isoform X2 [Microcaecilia unicolor]
MVMGISNLLYMFVLFTGMSLSSEATPDFYTNMSLHEQGIKGESAMLPCTFSNRHPSYNETIVVIWRTDLQFKGPLIFQCSITNSSSGDHSSDNCTKSDSETHRYRLAGDPRQHNLSLQILNVTYEDKKRYYCRVNLTNITGEAWTDKTGTDFTVVARPKVMNLTLQGNVSVGRSLECVVEGLPLPNITWDRPENEEMPTSVETELAEQNLILSNLSVSQNGTYTCRAQNEFGRDEKSLNVGEKPRDKEPGFLLLLLVLLVLLILLCLGTAVAILIYKKRKGSILCWKVSTSDRLITANNDHSGPLEAPSKAPEVSDNLDQCKVQPTGPLGQEQKITGKSEDSCTYADIQFAPKQGKGNEKRTNSIPEAEEVTYATVVTQPKKEKLQEAR